MVQSTVHTQPNRVPLSIITGFLGSGKTTMLNHLVEQPGMESVALIINEFGEIGLDNLLFESAIENTLLLENGCICCSIRGDLVDTIGDLFTRVRLGQIPEFSRVLIETTGLADPAPIVNTLQTETVVADRIRLDRVVTIVDGVQGEAQARSHPEAMMQIAQADIGIISKTDLADRSRVDRLAAFIRQVNPSLDVATMKHGEIVPATLFGEREPGPRSASDTAAAHLPDGHTHHHEPAEHRHGAIATWSFVHDSPIDRRRLFDWLTMLYSLRPQAMLRLKGLVHVTDSEGPLLVQAVGPCLSPVRTLPRWPEKTKRTRLTLIFREMEIGAVKDSFNRHVVK